MNFKYDRRRRDSAQQLAEGILKYILKNPSDDKGEVATLEGADAPPASAKLNGTTAVTLHSHFDLGRTVSISEITAALGALEHAGFVEHTSDRYFLTPAGTKEAGTL